MRKAEKGFTLIELMITVAVIAILAAIAYPSYTEYVRRGRRVEAQNLLNDAAARQERYRSQNGTYSGDVRKLKLPTGSTSEHGYYTLSTSPPEDSNSFTLKATRAGAQIGDPKCGDFTLDDKGVKEIARGTPGTATQCWR